jgi:phage terminase small subunit
MMPANAAEDRPALGRHPPPPWLDDAARRLWHRLEPQVSDDDDARRRLAVLCVAHSWWERTSALVAGLEPAERTWRDAGGASHSHPLVTVEDALAADIHDLGASLGLEGLGRPRRRRTSIVFLDEGE